MRAGDLVVEVRDQDLVRVGQILPRDLQLAATLRDCDVGEWVLTLPTGHPMVPYLRTPGAGLLVTDRRTRTVWWSGLVAEQTRERSSQAPAGLDIFTGVTDDVLLASNLCYPVPSNPDATTQSEAANDVRRGLAETLMRGYVSDNIGPTAPAGRRARDRFLPKIAVAPDQGRGIVVQRSPRFTRLLDELRGICAADGTLRFQLHQDDDVLLLDISTVVDRTAMIRFDIRNGDLTSEKVQVAAPGTTRVLPAGQGQGGERTILSVTSPESLEAEADWWSIEAFVDQRQTDDPLELQQAGDELLFEQGFTATNSVAIPADRSMREYGIDYGLGDLITVVVDGTERTARITSVAITATKDLTAVALGIGDPSALDSDAAAAKTTRRNSARLDNLDRADGGTGGGEPGPAGEIVSATAHGIATGLQPTIDLGGTPSKRTMDFGIPAGAQGIKGDPGTAASISGASATTLPAGSAATVAMGGTAQARSFAFGIPRGDPGTPGDDGQSAAIVGISAVTLAPGSQATATMGGTPLARTFTLGIPQGAKGDPGDGGLPVGSIVQYGAATAPSGYLLCNGAAYSRTTYAALFAIIGTSYGAGNGSTTFNVPDLRGRVPVGQLSADPDFVIPGKTGGEKAHTLVLSEIPSHSHGTANYPSDATGGTNWFTQAGGSYGFTGARIPAAGGGLSHNNLQPYLTLNFIIKY